MSTIYGISNCDTVRKARKWLSDHQMDISYHDFRKDGLDEASLKSWVSAVGWEVLLNKRGTTFRQLSDEQKSDINEGKAIALMLEYPAMIKRPVLEHGDQIHVGFIADDYQKLFNC